MHPLLVGVDRWHHHKDKICFDQSSFLNHADLLFTISKTSAVFTIVYDINFKVARNSLKSIQNYASKMAFMPNMNFQNQYYCSIQCKKRFAAQQRKSFISSRTMIYGCLSNLVDIIKTQL